MIVLDTNAFIWWISASDKLSKKVKKAIEEAEKKKEIYVSSISILEIYVLIKKGRLKLNTLPDNWLEKVESLPYVNFVPVDNKIAVASVELPDFDHKDPADRMIVATALINNATLITSDQEILKYSKVKAIW